MFRSDWQSTISQKFRIWRTRITIWTEKLATSNTQSRRDVDNAATFFDLTQCLAVITHNPRFLLKHLFKEVLVQQEQAVRVDSVDLHKLFIFDILQQTRRTANTSRDYEVVNSGVRFDASFDKRLDAFRFGDFDLEESDLTKRELFAFFNDCSAKILSCRECACLDEAKVTYL